MKKKAINDSVYKRFMIIVLLIGFLIRFWRLDLNPVGIVHDELHQFINAKSIALTGKGAAGTGAGVLQNKPFCDGNCIFGELPSFLLVPFAFFRYSFPWLKLPFIFLSLFVIYFGGKLFENITNNNRIGIISAFFIAINPWSINFGRSSYENMFSFAFYLSSMYLLTKKPFKFKNQLIGILLGFAASLSYFGAKPIFIPLMFIGLFYGWVFEQKNWKKYVLLAFLSVLLITIYGMVLKNSYAGLRLNETKIFNESISQMVDDQRRMSLEIPVGRDLFINKYTVLFKQLLSKYFKGLSLNYLFNEGELGYDHFMISNHAFMYLIDLPLIITGLIVITKISTISSIFLVLILLSLPITPTLSNYASTYALRSGLTYPILAGVAGVGFYYFYSKGKKILKISLVFLYLIFFTNFLVMYWYRNPFEKSAGWVFYERQAIKYIIETKKLNENTQFELITKDPVDIIYAYALFSGNINEKEFIKTMNKTISSREYIIDNIKVKKECPQDIDNSKVYLISQDSGCIENQDAMKRIAEPRDSGARWYIPNDILCKGYQLPRYPYPRKLELFNIEDMSREMFCKNWLSLAI